MGHLRLGFFFSPDPVYLACVPRTLVAAPLWHTLCGCAAVMLLTMLGTSVSVSLIAGFKPLRQSATHRR